MRTTSLIFLFLSAVLPAQEKDVAVRGLSLSESTFPDLWVLKNKRPVALTFSPYQPTLPIRADRNSPLLVFVGALNPEGNPIDSTPKEVELPPKSDSILMIGWMTGDKPTFLAFDDPFRTSSNDDWIIINTTSKTVAIQVGEKTDPLSLKPGSHSKMKVSAPSDTGASTTIIYEDGNEWKPFYSSYMPIFSDKRCIVIIAQEGENFRVKIIPDNPVPQEAED